MQGYRSRKTTSGRNMAGARALWRATGMTDQDFGKPIIAIANSFTQFVPGHVHLHDVGQRVKKIVDAAGGWGVEFNTIAVDDGIAMGHDGMLYSLPSRDLIAKRRAAMNERGDTAWIPNRKREVSQALRAYGVMATSAAKGAVRDVDQLVERRKL